MIRAVTVVSLLWAYGPLQVAVNNGEKLTRWHQFAGLALLMAGLGVGMLLVGVTVGGSRRQVSTSVGVVGAIFGLGAPILGIFPGHTIALISIFAVVAVIYRLARVTKTDLVVVCVLVGLLVGSAFEAVKVALSWGSPVEVTESGVVFLPSNSRRPDVLLVVLDGHASVPVLRDDFDYDFGPLEARYEAEGFELIPEIESPYATTFGAIPAMMEGTGLLAPDTLVTPAVRRQLYEMLGGSNSLARSLTQAGYHMTMVEAGWSGSACGNVVDTCVANQLWTEELSVTVGSSLMNQWVGTRLGHPFAPASLESLKWLREHVSDLLANGRPDFVFAHVLLPHGPHVLSPSCDRWTQRPSDERDAYIGQLECANDSLLDLIPANEESLVVVVGDHGSDLRGQMLRPPETWDQEDIRERSTTLLAVRAPDDCSFAGIKTTVNIGRSVLRCLGGSPSRDLGPSPYVLVPWSSDGRHPYRLVAVDRAGSAS